MQQLVTSIVIYLPAVIFWAAAFSLISVTLLGTETSPHGQLLTSRPLSTRAELGALGAIFSLIAGVVIYCFAVDSTSPMEAGLIVAGSLIFAGGLSAGVILNRYTAKRRST
jgi:drug/metabolite transporter (DMT)-like permease